MKSRNYYAATSNHAYYNFGSADACYRDPPQNGFLCANGWTHWIDVAAGAYVGNELSGDRNMPPIGVLLVDMGSRDLSGEYRMDEREGSLRIVGAK